jgi:hypothetical protein
MEHIDSARVSTAPRNPRTAGLPSEPRSTIPERQHAGFAVAEDDWSYPHSRLARHQFLI